jgi:hypothetical protein
VVREGLTDGLYGSCHELAEQRERDMRVVTGESKDTAEKSGKERNNGRKVQERGKGSVSETRQKSERGQGREKAVYEKGREE